MERAKWRELASRGELRAGAELSFSRTFTESDVEVFGGITRDDNPVHSDGPWCELKGFDRPICHGLLVGSMICEPGGQLGWLASGMSFRFLKPTYIGDTITCRLRITEVDGRGFARAVADYSNQRDELVLEAELQGFLPNREEQMRLAELL